MEFWNRMEKLGQQGPPQILSTHPSNHNREEKIREWLPQAHEKAASSDCHAMSGYGEYLFHNSRYNVLIFTVDQFSAAFGRDRW